MTAPVTRTAAMAAARPRRASTATPMAATSGRKKANWRMRFGGPHPVTARTTIPMAVTAPQVQHTATRNRPPGPCGSGSSAAATPRPRPTATGTTARPRSPKSRSRYRSSRKARSPARRKNPSCEVSPGIDPPVSSADPRSHPPAPPAAASAIRTAAVSTSRRPPRKARVAPRTWRRMTPPTMTSPIARNTRWASPAAARSAVAASTARQDRSTTARAHGADRAGPKRSGECQRQRGDVQTGAGPVTQPDLTQPPGQPGVHGPVGTDGEAVPGEHRVDEVHGQHDRRGSTEEPGRPQPSPAPTRHDRTVQVRVLACGLVLDEAVVHDVLRTALRSGGRFAEVFAEERHSTSIRLDDRRIEELTEGTDRGAGIRVVAGDTSAYAYSNRLDPGGPPEGAQGQAEEAARTFSGEVRQVVVGYGDSVQRLLVANSTGTWTEEERHRVRLIAQVVASRDGVVQTGFEGPAALGGAEVLDAYPPGETGAEAARMAVTMLDGVPAPAGEMPVVVGPAGGGVLFHEACGHGLEADTVGKEASVYRDRLGERLASAVVTVVDDASVPGAWGSFAVDDEGTGAERTVLF